MLIGEAYGFLHYNGGQRDISMQLAGFKDDEPVPPELGFLVGKTGDFKAGFDSALGEILQLANEVDLNYAIKATLPGKRNAEAAEQVVRGLMWLNGILYRDGEPFYAEVVYKEGEGYVRMQK